MLLSSAAAALLFAWPLEVRKKFLSLKIFKIKRTQDFCFYNIKKTYFIATKSIQRLDFFSSEIKIFSFSFDNEIICGEISCKRKRGKTLVLMLFIC